METVRRSSKRRVARPAAGRRCVVVRPRGQVTTRQGLPNWAGVSSAQGATRLCMHLVTLPPGGRARPHLHREHESTVYLLEGDAKTYWWDEEGARHEAVQHAGEFLFIPAGVPHQVVNLSPDRPARAVIARTDPNEQESVELFEPPRRMRRRGRTPV